MAATAPSATSSPIDRQRPDMGPQRAALRDRIVAESLTAVRIEAEQQETAGRLHRLCDDSVTVLPWARARARAMQKGWGR